MPDENNDIPVDGADSVGADGDVNQSALILDKATETVITTAEMLVSFLPSAMVAGNSMSNAMNMAAQFLKRQTVWSIVLFAMAAITTGNLISAIVVANKLAQVCGR